MMKAFHLTLPIAALMVSSAFAQPPGMDPGMGGGPPPPPRDSAERKEARPPAFDGDLLQELGLVDQVMANQSQLELTAEQQAKIKELMNEQSKAFNELRWPQQAEQEKLTLLLREDSLDETSATEQFSRMLTIENQMKMSRLKLLIQVKNLLTAEQKAKLKSLKSRNQQGPPPGDGPEGRRGAGPGGPPPGMEGDDLDGPGGPLGGNRGPRGDRQGGPPPL